MTKAVIFDMYETLITLFNCEVYKGAEIASDMNIPEKTFREIWDPSEDDRTLGNRSFEDVIEEILKANHIYEQELYEKIVRKRHEFSYEVFKHIHPDIIPMLKALKDKGIKTALISNCYYEEREAIKSSELYPLFDTVCMSCEVKIKKPDDKIFMLCAERLGVRPEECLYVGDGGSHELDAARANGMRPLQAVWYLKDGLDQPCGRLDGFDHAESPMDVVTFAL